MSYTAYSIYSKDHQNASSHKGIHLCNKDVSRQNKDVSWQNKDVSWQNKAISWHNKENHERNKEAYAPRMAYFGPAVGTMDFKPFSGLQTANYVYKTYSYQTIKEGRKTRKKEIEKDKIAMSKC